MRAQKALAIRLAIVEMTPEGMEDRLGEDGGLPCRKKLGSSKGL
jgi:hypothetical protein